MPEAPLSTFSAWVISWGALSLFAGTLLAIGFGVLSMNPAQYAIAQACFSGSALLIILRVGWWLGIEQSDASLRHRLLLSVIVFGITGVLWTAAVSWAQRLKEASQLSLRMVFSKSPILTEARQKVISREFQGLKNYLVGIGFDIPDVVPPVQINMVGGMIASGQSEYGYTLFFTEKTVDNRDEIRNAYGYYVFTRILGTPKTSLIEDGNRWAATMFFGTYFVNSYSNTKYSGRRSWDGALWELREKLGQDFMDHAMFYAVKMFDVKPYNGQEDLNRFFRYRLERGLGVMDNPGNTWRQILDEVVKKFKLDVPDLPVSVPSASEVP